MITFLFDTIIVWMCTGHAIASNSSSTVSCDSLVFIAQETSYLLCTNNFILLSFILGTHFNVHLPFKEWLKFIQGCKEHISLLERSYSSLHQLVNLSYYWNIIIQFMILYELNL